MPKAQVTVRWKDGLHLRRAARLVRLAQRFRSTISLRRGGKLADARSVLSIAMLCATMGTSLEVEARGDDAGEAVQAMESAFVDADDAL